MSKLSVSTAWNEAVPLVKQQAGQLFLLAFLLIVFPGVALQFVLPRWIPAASAGAGSPPDPSQILAALPLLIVAFIPVLVLSLLGHLAVNMVILEREKAIGAALSRAARRILPLLGAFLLLMIAVVILALPVAGLFALTYRGGHGAWLFLAFLILWLIFVFAAVRLILLIPVAAAEDVGPIGIVQRSWRLTAGHFWKLLGFLILLMIVVVVLGLVVTALGGIVITLVAGSVAAGSTGALMLGLLGGILQMVWVVYFAAMIVRIYVQLSGGGASTATVFE